MRQTQITTGQTARELGLSEARVRQLDAELRPERIAGRRLYDPDRVAAFAADRARGRELAAYLRERGGAR